jgi:hypothetical protein
MSSQISFRRGALAALLMVLSATPVMAQANNVLFKGHAMVVNPTWCKVEVY